MQLFSEKIWILENFETERNSILEHFLCVVKIKYFNYIEVKLMKLKYSKIKISFSTSGS